MAKYITVKDFARERGVCTDTVYDAIKRGEIQVTRIGRAIRIVVEQTPQDVAHG